MNKNILFFIFLIQTIFLMVGTDEYYYYAILDTNGEFAPSIQKVGIDPPLSESYNLERSPSRLAEIEAERELFR